MTLLSPLFAVLVFSHVAFAALPQVDFDRMGKVGLAGAFAGLGLFDSSSSQFDPSTSTLFFREPSGGLSRLASTNSPGKILAGCALQNLYYFGGSFSSIGSTSAANVASYNPSTGAFASLGSNGPNGQVNAMYCDAKENKVWVGGQFSSPGPAVAVWDVKKASWSSAPFGGLSGAGAQVYSITSNSSQSSLFFAGSFVTSFTGGSSVVSGSNNPALPPSAGATPFSSSLVPVPLQSAEVEGSPSSRNSQFSNITTILCPSGPDGPGNTWLGSASPAVITARTFAFMNSNGIRLGNTFVSGYGTTGFSVTTIPDNTVQTLRYVDPKTGQNQTCTDPCPLLTDSTIPYQDFLFSNAVSITGVQVKLSGYTGSGPGLHLFQILSSGAFASALDQQNQQSCFAPNPSNTTRTGSWTEKIANTNIPGTTQAVLVSDVAVGTPGASGPSFTWIPYVTASGIYDVNLLVPGCSNFQDCGQRTSVQVTVFPGQGLQPWVTTVSQQNNNDAVNLVYSGPIVPSSPNFVVTVSMTLAQQPVGTGVGGQYEIVADRVQLILKSANETFSTTSGGGGSSSSGSGGIQGARNGFGFYEWPLSAAGSNIDATKVLSNSTETLADSIGFDLFQGNGGLTSTPNAIRAVVQDPSGAIYVGGQFQLASGGANVAVFKNGNLAALPNKGLNGPVSSLLLSGGWLYVGGSFEDTVDGSTQGRLKGIAAYNIQQNQWTPMQAGVDGAVSGLGFDDGHVQIVGNFTRMLSPNGGGWDVSGFAAWDTSKGTWANSGAFVVGNMSFIGNGTAPAKGQTQSQFVAGSVSASLPFGGSGFVMVENGKNGPVVSPLGVPLQHDISSSTTPQSRRDVSPREPDAKIPDLFARQSPAQLPPLPSSLPAPAPAVLAGAFWTNSSTSDEVVILGGNFSFHTASTTAQGVAIYDPSSSTLTALQGTQINGTVRALLVVNNMLYVGGQFTQQGTNVNGLAVYDLVKQQWDGSQPDPLQSASGSTPVVVRSLTRPPSRTDLVVVAGSFSQAGSLRCQSICSLTVNDAHWNALGDGIQGEVSSIAYAGNVLVASGSMSSSDNTAANVMQYTFSNGTWSAIGKGNDLPGPVTALEVNDGNSSSIFAAGRSNDGSSTFLSHWNGLSWRDLGLNIQGSSSIAQLAMVPLQNTHSKNDVIQADRMLMVSGSLADQSFGSASSALFDGQSLVPYISTASPSGSLGSISSLFRSFSAFSFTQRRFLKTAVVILISIAIAAGIVFILALIAILWTLLSRRDEKMNPMDTEDDDDSTQHRPSSLLEHINAATRTTILGAQGATVHPTDKTDESGGVGAASAESDPLGPDAGDFARAETPSDAIFGGVVAADGGVSRPAHARYSFEGGGEGELPLKSGQEVEILDDRDPAWWYCRDMRTGREGVVPAAYLY